MTGDEIVGRLVKPRRHGAGMWTARCPAHEDKSPSLSVRELPDGQVLMHCFAGCAIEDICGAIGIELTDLFPESLEFAKSTKPRFSAIQVLEQLSDEAFFLVVAANQLARGKPFTDADRERLIRCAERFTGAIELVRGR